MAVSEIERLLELANSGEDTSINLAKRQMLSEADAEELFAVTRSGLQRISEWSKHSSFSKYDLFLEDGSDGGDQIVVGKFIRIHLYGGGKYDWVRVISIIDEPGEFVISVKPSHDPTERPPDETSISHFFGPEAVNNFCVQLHGKAVAVYVIGLNERQNTKFTDGLIESARNAAVANVGYYSGLQKAVWKEFCFRFLGADEPEATEKG